VLFERPLVLGYGKPKKVKLELQAQASNGSSAESTFTISSTEDGKSETYCRGRATVG
jgi:hypothetical protein